MLKDELKQYAVYKENKQPWTQKEYEVISYLMGDKNPVSKVTEEALKRTYIYYSNNVLECFPFYHQIVAGKTPIEFKDFLALVGYKQLAFFKKDKSYWTFDELLDIEKKTGLKRGGPEYSHSPESNKYVYSSLNEFYCWSNQTDKSIETKIEFPYHLLDLLVQMKMPTNLCSEIATPDSYKLLPLGLGMEGLIHNFGERGLLPLTPFSIPARQHGKTVAIDSLMKIIGDTKMINTDRIGASAHILAMIKLQERMFLGKANPVREKFLTLKVKNGLANAKSLIYQTHSTGIKDPRQFIKDIISAEIKRVETAILTTSFDVVSYGFNIKLAAQVAYLTGTKANLTAGNTELDLDDVITFYEFEKENASYSRSRERNEDICPFIWIKDHLTHDKINKPGKHSLFASNKIRIFIKNGELHYHTNDTKFNVDIKFNPELNQFSF